MELLVHGLGQGRHVYHPFPTGSLQQKTRLLSLEDLCKRCILRRTSLRRLKPGSLPLPPYLMKNLTLLDSEDFIEIECAPFKDILDFNMYHRSLTYRVRSTLDGEDYMAAHATAQETFQTEDFWKWVNVCHQNIMRVYAIAVDSVTGNNFLIMDIPEATLKRLEVFLMSQGLCFPEYFLWKIACQLSSVIMYVEAQGLTFGRFDLKNIYVINDRVLMDNKLTWKSWIDSLTLRNRVQSIFLDDKVNIGGHYELQVNSQSSASVACLGFVLTRLASIALVERKSRIVDNMQCKTIPFFKSVGPSVSEGSTNYSAELLDMLVRLHSTEPPPLNFVYNKACEMMAKTRGQMPSPGDKSDSNNNQVYETDLSL